MKWDKSTWGEGPWQDEVDRFEWRHESGLPCLIKRSPTSGSWCGYVGLPPGHKFYGQNYDSVDAEVRVHGGLTYSAFCDGDEGEGICHVPLEGEASEVFWLGFDCSHAFDLAPAIEATLGRYSLSANFLGNSVYRDISYITNETNNLATQLKNLG